MARSTGKILIRGGVAICAGILIAVGGVSAANAVTVYPPEGGTWIYSAGTQWVESTYKHNARTHKTSACNSSACSYSGWKAPGVKALAVKATTLSGNTAYYDVY